MAIINSNGQNGGSTVYSKLYGAVKTTIENAASIIPAKEFAHVVSAPATESFDDLTGFNAADMRSNFGSLVKDVEARTGDAIAQYAAEAFGDQQAQEPALGAAVQAMRANGDKQAALAVAILAQSHNNVRSYYANESAADTLATATATPAMINAGIPVVPQWAAEEFRELYTTESFDEKVTDQWRYHSYAIAMSAAKQTEFGALWYRTQMLTPDNAGFILSIRRNMCWDGFQQTDTAGKAVENTKININTGLLDYTVTETDTVDLFPVVRPGKNDAYFVDPTLITPWDENRQGTPFKTNFLTFTGPEGGNLINLGMTPDRLQKGTPNNTDSLDSYVAVGKVAISVSDGTKTEVFIFDTEGTEGATFLAARESNFRNSDLRFWPRAMKIHPETTLQGDVKSDLLKAAQTAGYTLDIGFNMDGRVNHEFGNYEMNGANTALTGAWKIAGQGAGAKFVEVPKDDAALKAALSGLTFKVIGWYPAARLTNINQLEIGKRIDSDMMKFGFMIPTLSPITIQKPAVVEDDKVYPKMEAMQSYYRLQIRNAAVTSLLNRADTMKKYLGNDRPHELESVPQLEGLGQYYVRPYYLEIEIDVLNDLNSLRSEKKVSDIQGLITSRMQEAISRADQLTAYSSILEQEFGANVKPHVAIGTDPRLPLYIMTQGDDRTLGTKYDFTIATVSDLRMKDQIFMSFTLPNQSEIHPLDFGILGMIPEYITNFSMIRDQRVANEIRLTPRYRYIHFLPILIRIKLKNLEQAIASRTALDVNGVAPVQP